MKFSKKVRRSKVRRSKVRRSKVRRNKKLKGGTGFRSPEYINFTPFSKYSYNIADIPLNRALGAASR